MEESQYIHAGLHAQYMICKNELALSGGGVLIAHVGVTTSGQLGPTEQAASPITEEWSSERTSLTPLRPVARTVVGGFLGNM